MSTPAPRRVSPEDFASRGTEPSDAAALVEAVVTSSTGADGTPPLDEAATLALRHRGLDGAALWTTDHGFALRRGTALDVAVEPAFRGRGHGRELAVAAAADPGPLDAWSHGDHPAARVLAEDLGMARVRELWVLRRSLADELPAVEAGPGIGLRTFAPGDEAELLRVNSAAFADHREQGSLSEANLVERMAEPWFDPAGIFLAEDHGELLGFHWTKVHAGDPAYGEVYVVGIAPHAQGRGLGRLLTLIGLHHLRDAGLGEVLLYVESDNAAAVAVYHRLGFEHAANDTHVMYARGGRGGARKTPC